MTDPIAGAYDVVVVGGGAAGLNGALMLARSRRSVLVIDAGEPRNAPAAGVHGFLSRDGISPAALLEAGRSEVRGYGGQVVAGWVSAAAGTGDGFSVTLDDGRMVGARRLLVTTGLVDELPNVPGVRERWGRDVIHCPYCHGWEVRDQAVGILSSGPMSVHQALLFRQLTEDVTFFLHTAPEPSDEDRERLAARGVTVIEGEVTALVVTDDRLTGARLASGAVVPRQAVVVAPRFVARAGVLVSLGLAVTEHPMGVGSFVAADPTGLTAVPGVWVAGNVADPMAQVVGAAAAGAMAAAMINADLVAEDTRRGVAAYRNTLIAASERTSATGDVSHGHATDTTVLFTKEFWDARYRSAGMIWSGNPNPRLVEHAVDLALGTALDVGCGEGADAIWLAARGWQVTGLDLSTVALDRAAERAAAASEAVAARITWQQADLLSWDPAPMRFDLVSAQFIHLPKAERDPVFQRLAESVSPGGTLLIVGHHPSDLQTTLRRPQQPELFFTAADVAAFLDPQEWEMIVSAAVPRGTTDPEGRTVTIHDAVLRARRRGSYMIRRPD